MNFYPWRKTRKYLSANVWYARILKPASMAQLDAHQTGDQEIEGSNSPGNIFDGHSFPSADSSRVVFSFC